MFICVLEEKKKKKNVLAVCYFFIFGFLKTLANLLLPDCNQLFDKIRDFATWRIYSIKSIKLKRFCLTYFCDISFSISSMWLLFYGQIIVKVQGYGFVRITYTFSYYRKYCLFVFISLLYFLILYVDHINLNVLDIHFSTQGKKTKQNAIF